jgi:hypothetical protein
MFNMRRRFMKKTIIALFIAFILIPCVGAKNRIELSGGYNWFAMSDYNESVDDASDDARYLGVRPEMYKLTGAGAIEAVALFSREKTGAGVAFYGRFAYYPLRDDKSRWL